MVGELLHSPEFKGVNQCALPDKSSEVYLQPAFPGVRTSGYNHNLVCGAWKWFFHIRAFFDWWSEAIWNVYLGCWKIYAWLHSPVDATKFIAVQEFSAAWLGNGGCAALSNSHFLDVRRHPELQVLMAHWRFCLHRLFCSCCLFSTMLHVPLVSATQTVSLQFSWCLF